MHRRTPSDDRGRDWSDAAVSQGMRRMAGNARGRDRCWVAVPAEPPEGLSPGAHLAFGLLVSRAVREYSSVV